MKNLFHSNQAASLIMPATPKANAFSGKAAFRQEMRETASRMKKSGLPGSATPVRKRQETAGFRFIDLFAGIGGLRKGFDAINGTCVFTSEWDKYSVETYLANHNCNIPMSDQRGTEMR